MAENTDTDCVSTGNCSEDILKHSIDEPSFIEDSFEAVASPRSADGSSFISYYKYNYKTRESSQEARRQEYLKYQRENRHKDIDEKRKLAEILKDISIEAEPMEVMPTPRKKKTIKRKLMLTEWMREVPSDYPDNWIAKFCPEGHRNLIVASKHSTKCIGRRTGINFSFLSALPGGGGTDEPGFINTLTLLDCIYNEKLKTFFILDVIAWNGRTLFNCEADCRFFFLKSRFEELRPCRNEAYHFRLIEHVECDPSLIQEKMNNLLQIDDQELLYDGVVFYHRESRYVFTETPLALWLKSFMIPEMLNIDIHPSYNRKIPEGYVNLHQFFEQKKEQRRNKRTAKMDTT